MDKPIELSEERRRHFRRLAMELVSEILCEEYDEAADLVREIGRDLDWVRECGVWTAGTTLLHYAAKTGHVKLVTRIIDAECFDINARDDDGTTPLFFAASGGHLELVALLLERGADIESRRSLSPSASAAVPSALVTSLIFKHEQVALFLIEKGASVAYDVRDAGGRSIAGIVYDNDLVGVFKCLCRRKYFNEDYVGAMAKVAQLCPEKIMDFCLAFPPLSDTVAGAEVHPVVSKFWCERGRQKILAWRAGCGIEAAIGSAAGGDRPQMRSAAPHL
jgi:hypothetical protein